MIEFILFGGITISSSQLESFDFVSRKAEALLAYLACEPRSHSREALATMFWDNRPTERAMGNLRVVLTNLRKLTGPRLDVNRSSVELILSDEIRLDVRTVDRLLTQAERCFQSDGPFCPRGIKLLQEAVSLYRGEFLHGVYLRDALGFEEWALLTRERLERRLIEAMEKLARVYLGQRSYQEGIELLSRLLAQDPYREANHRLMMRMLARSGKKNRALAHFQQVQTLLRLELDVEPTVETRRLHQHLRDAAPMEPQLPAQFNAFVGRAAELQAISSRLADPGCRLLTLLGQGGIGKSRLAIEFARLAAKEQWDLYPDGVYFIPLSSVSSVEPLAEKVAASLGLAFSGQTPPDGMLLAHLREREMLLILDNLEHLLEPGARLIERILRGAPGVTLLVTSQARLRLRAEWLLELQGLQCANPGQAARGSDADWSCSAAQLFRQTANRLRPSFSLAAELPHVCRICQLVGGLPLGIELAASLILESDCAQIAESMQADLNFVATDLLDIPPRHRSLRAIFEHAWALLEAHDQQVYQRLSLFRGSFTQEAAELVTDATSDQISQLLDRSLLTRAGGGRFELHGALRQFLADKMGIDPYPPAAGPVSLPAAGEPARWEWYGLARQHSRYFLDLLSQADSRLHGAEQHQAAEEISASWEDIRAAWAFAVAWNKPEAAAQALRPFCRYLLIRSWYGQGAELTAAAAERFAAAADPPAAGDLLCGRLLAYQGEFLELMGRHQESVPVLERAMALLASGPPAYAAFAANKLAAAHWRMGSLEQAEAIYRQLMDQVDPEEDADNAALAADGLGVIAYLRGEYPAAQEHITRGGQLCQRVGDPRRIARNSNHLGLVMRATGDFPAAAASFKRAMALFDEVGDRWGVASVGSNLGLLAEAAGQLDEAAACYRRSYRIFRDIGNLPGVALAANNLGVIAQSREAYLQAEQLYQEALAIRRQLKDQVGAARSLTNLGGSALAACRYDDAERWLRQGLDAALAVDSLPTVLEAITGLSELLLIEGHLDGAAAALSFVQAHPALVAQLQGEVAAQLGKLEGKMAAARFQAAAALGRELPLPALCRCLLERTELPLAGANGSGISRSRR